MGNCEQIQSQLNALIDGELPIFRRLAISFHVLKCQECRERLDQYRRISFAATKIRVFEPVSNPKLKLRFAYGGLVAVVIGLLAFPIWPKAQTPKPQALIYDQNALIGKAMPVSAIYSEDNRFVVRDTENGNVLASAPGKTRTDAFNAISIANHASPNEAKEIELVFGSGSIHPPKNRDEVFILKSDGLPEKDGEPVMIFFSGEITELRGIELPKKGPVFFVQVLDPKFIPETIRWQPTTPILPPNKKTL